MCKVELRPIESCYKANRPENWKANHYLKSIVRAVIRRDWSRKKPGIEVVSDVPIKPANESALLLHLPHSPEKLGPLSPVRG